MRKRWSKWVLAALALVCLGGQAWAAESLAEEAPAPQQTVTLPQPPAYDLSRLGLDLTVDEVWRALPRFGLALFGSTSAAGKWTSGAATQPGNAPSAQPTSPSVVPPSYVLGPGDELTIHCWSGGIEHLNTKLGVTTDGQIYVPPVGEISVAGQTIGAVGGVLGTALREYYPRSQTTATLSQPRAIELTVIGDVQQPGRHFLPGAATVFSALQSAGGPTEAGSLRHLRVLTPGKPAQEVDLYSFLLEGEAVALSPLTAGCTLFVGPVQAEVGLAGLVRRPGRYEVRPNTTCADALRLAGGLAGQAYQTEFSLWRVSGGRQRTLVSLSLTQAQTTLLQDGDLLVIKPVVEQPRGAVSVLGPVQRAGAYSLTPGMRVADLLQRCEGPTEAAHLGRGLLWRLDSSQHRTLVAVNLTEALRGAPTDNLLLQADDRLQVLTREEAERKSTVSVAGEVMRPGEYPWGPGMRLSDLLTCAGGLADQAYSQQASLVRTRETDAAQELVSVSLAAALNGEAEADVLLQRGDVLQVASREAVGEASQVWIGGQVRNPGVYPRYGNMRVTDLIFAAGGLLAGASPQVTITRGRTPGEPQTLATTLDLHSPGSPLATPNLILQDDDVVAIQGDGRFVRKAPQVRIEGRVVSPGLYALPATPDRHLTVSQALQQAGGLLEDANPAGILLFRMRSDLWLRRTDVLQKVLGTFNRLSGANQSSATAQPGGQPGDTEAMRLAQQVSAQFTKTVSGQEELGIIIPPREISLSALVNLVPLDGEKMIASEGREGDATLTDEDIIVVQPRVNTVAVVGAVAQAGEVSYVPGERPGSLWQRVGGLTDDADPAHAAVLRANGTALPVSRAGVLKPGDIVVVPSRHLLKSARPNQTFFDKMWQGLLSVFALNKVL